MLVTGFGPFRNHAENPSAVLGSLLADKLSASYETLTVTYPFVEKFAKSLDPAHSTVLCLGLNAKATELKFELYAHNHIGKEPGSSKRAHSRTVIRKSGPKTLGQTLATPSQLPDLPVATSFTPGDYLCNFVLYSLLVRYPEKRIGFVHVPTFETMSGDLQLERLNDLVEYLNLSDFA